MTTVAAKMITNLAGPGFVPPTMAGIKRYPFVFIIDVSGSTGMPPDPDINHINKAISILLDTLRNPTPSSDLQKQADAIDICIIAYSATATEILPWSIVQNLPPHYPPSRHNRPPAPAPPSKPRSRKSAAASAITKTRPTVLPPACRTSSTSPTAP